MPTESPQSKRTLPRGLRPLRHRAYRRVWLGAFISNIGTWVQTVAVGIYVTELTGKASWTGIVAAAAFLPGALFSPVGGALADRIPRKVLLLITTAVEASCAALLAVLVSLGAAPPIVVTLIVFVTGAAGTISWPTFSAILPELVPPDEIPATVGLSSAQWNLGRIIGPAIAGVVLLVGSYELAFTINAFSFVAVIIAIAPLRIPGAAPPEHAFFRSIATAARFVHHDRGLRHAFPLLAINSFVTAPFIALVPAMALKVFKNESPGTSILVSAQGVGALLMAVSVGGFVHRFGVRRTLGAIFVATPFAVVAYAFSPILAVAALTIAVLGFLYIGAINGVTTSVQMRTPSAMRGRVFSLSVAILSLLYPAGSVVQGWLGDAIGLRRTTALSGAVLALALLITVALQRGFAPGLDDPVVAGAPGAAATAEGPEPPIEMIPD